MKNFFITLLGGYTPTQHKDHINYTIRGLIHEVNEGLNSKGLLLEVENITVSRNGVGMHVMLNELEKTQKSAPKKVAKKTSTRRKKIMTATTNTNAK